MPGVAYGPPRAARPAPFTRRVPLVQAAGLVTEAAVTGLTLYLPQARTLRREPRWDEVGQPIISGTAVRVLARTPYVRGGTGGDGEALWFVRITSGLRGWIVATNDEITGGLERSYMAAFPDEEPVPGRVLLSALPEDRTPLVGTPAPGAETTGGVSGLALAGIAALLAALGLYYLTTGSDR